MSYELSFFWVQLHSLWYTFLFYFGPTTDELKRNSFELQVAFVSKYREIPNNEPLFQEP
jgi:hypothetical protein